MTSRELVICETQSMMKQLLVCALYSRKIAGSQFQAFTERWGALPNADYLSHFNQISSECLMGAMNAEGGQQRKFYGSKIRDSEAV